jgi:hypothetical protein
VPSVSPPSLPRAGSFSPSTPSPFPGGPDLEELATRIPFDSRQVQLRKVGADWKLLFGGYVLKDFGPEEQLAREALRTIQFYRFTEQLSIGAGERRFEYYLVNGQAPRGRMLNQFAFAFHPDQLAVREVDGEWWVMYHHIPLFRFDRPEDAHRAHAVIRRHRFDHVCFLGRPQPVMMYLIRTR